MSILAVLGAVALVLGGTAAAHALTVVGTITTGGPQPTTSVFSPDGQFVYVLTGTGVEKVRLSDNTIVGSTMAVGSAPFDMVINPAGSHVFVTNEGSQTVSIINTSTSATTTYAFTGANAPTGACSYGLMTPREAALSSDGNTLYLSNESDDCIARLDVSNPSSIPAPTFLTVSDQSWAMALSPDDATLYVGLRNGSAIDLVYTAGPMSTGPHVPQARFPAYLAASPDGQYLFSSDTASGQLVRLSNTAASTASGIVGLLGSPSRVAFSADGSLVYVSSSSSGGQLVSYHTATMTLASSVVVGSGPASVSGNAAGTAFMVMRPNSDIVVHVSNPATPSPTPSLAATGAEPSQLPALGWAAGVGLSAGVLLLGAAWWMRARKL